MTLPLEKNAICTLLTNKENYNGSSYFVNGLEDLNVPNQNYCIYDNKSKDDTYTSNLPINGDVLSKMTIYGYDIRNVEFIVENDVLFSRNYSNTHVVEFDLGPYGINLMKSRPTQELEFKTMFYNYSVKIIAGHFECIIANYLYFDTVERRRLNKIFF